MENPITTAPLHTFGTPEHLAVLAELASPPGLLTLERLRAIAKDAISRRLGYWQSNTIAALIIDDDGHAVLQLNSGGNCLAVESALELADIPHTVHGDRITVPGVTAVTAVTPVPACAVDEPQIDLPEDPVKGKRNGRPRDPDMAGRILEVVTVLIAERGLAGFAMDDVASHAGVGKASIYRRWRSIDAILVDVITGLGVRDVDWPGVRGPDGTVRDDLIGLATAATVGTRASAVRAVHGILPYRTDLAAAYFVGPARRLQAAIATVRTRAHVRGDGRPRSLPVHAAIALLNQDAAFHGRQPDQVEIAAVVDAVCGYTQVTR